MPIRRVAVIFDIVARPDTTGFYCRRALGQLADVEHFLPSDLDRLSREHFDLYLAIDDGLDYPIPTNLHPSAYWAIDTHLDFEREFQRAQWADVVFAAQRDGAHQLQQRGIPETVWLPLACDPEIHGKQNLPKQFDVCFVGNLFPGPREELVGLLRKTFPNSFFGRRFFAEMAQVYSQSRCVFNRSLLDDVNMRVFEALASGSLLLTNDLRCNGQDQLFRDGIHLATYRDADELVDKLSFYLQNEELRERIAETSRQAVLANHAYLHRMRSILTTVEKQLAEQARIHAVPDAGRSTPEVTAGVAELRDKVSDRGLTSIVIVTYGQLEYTRLCLESIRRHTDPSTPLELIVVDNGSTDGTVEYVRLQQDIKFIANSENRGFPAAANQGTQMAAGQNVLFLNNDTIVTPGWLDRMLAVLDGDQQIGLVGPCSNNVSGEQQVPASYERLDAIDPFAREWGEAHRGQQVTTDRLVGFCLLVRREVLNKIGLFDERFGIGNFEDDDLCRRAMQAGYRAVIAVDSFVHHFGHRTFLASGIDYGTLLAENHQKFLKKWETTGAAPVAAHAVPPGTVPPDWAKVRTVQVILPIEQQKARSERRPDNSPPRKTTLQQTQSIQPSPDPRSAELLSGNLTPSVPSRPRFRVARSASKRGLVLTPQTIRLSLCMIVRDNESTIGPALESIRPWVDEIIVVDTGSRDRTPEICRRHDARLFEFPWCDDFSAARNVSLQHACGEWIFWMDSDDTISVECGRGLRELADGSHADRVLGYVIQVHCPKRGTNGECDVTVVDHVKLIRNRPDLRFEGRIHEQLLPAIRRAGGEVAWTDLFVTHTGSDQTPEGWQRKLDRDLRILHKEIGEMPDHPFVLFNLGMTYADARQFDEAVQYLQRCLAVSPSADSHVRKAYALLVSTLGQANRHEEAWRYCEQGLKHYPKDKELLFRGAMLHHHFGRLEEAERTYRRVLEEPAERHFTSVHRDLAGNVSRHNLALVYEQMRRLDLAETQWRRIVHEAPNNVDAWRGLADVLMACKKFTDAETLAVTLLSQNGPAEFVGWSLRGKLAAARGDLRSAVRDFETADRQNPDDLEAMRLLCQALFEIGDLDRAHATLRQLIERAPQDAAAFHNLGAVHMRRQAYGQAADAFQRSVELRPDAPDTRFQLGLCLKQAGRSSAAIATWRELLERFPNHVAARDSLAAAGAALDARHLPQPHTSV